MVLGILIGPIADLSLRRSIITYGGDFAEMFARPIGLSLLALLFLFLFLMFRRLRSVAPTTTTDEDRTQSTTETNQTDQTDPERRGSDNE